MNIVFEGIDRVGKSSLIDYMRRHLDAVSYKMRVPRSIGQSMEFYGDHFDHLMFDAGPSLWDRGHVSEIVYSQLYMPHRTNTRWIEALRRMPRMVPRTHLVYLFPAKFDLMMDDADRPGADRNSEMRAYEWELNHLEDDWPVHRICAHHEVDVSNWLPYKGTRWMWKSHEQLMFEVLAATGPVY